MKIAIHTVLWVLVAFLGYKLYQSITGPVKFNQLRNERYAKVIDQLKLVREAQIAHHEVTRTYAGSFDDLVSFIDTAEFAIVHRRDTIIPDVERNKAFGLDPYSLDNYYLEETIIDTVGFKPIKDSLFKGSDDYRTMMEVPIAGVDEKIELEAGTVESEEKQVPVFEARISKDILLYDQPKDLVIQEKQVVSVDGVNGTHIRVGSMEEVTTNGNWPVLYDSPGEQQAMAANR